MASTADLGEIDALVVGAGPAGATVALNLAPLHRVMLVDRRSEPLPRIGESLPPAARRLLRDMGLWESFTREGHSPCYGNRATWGAEQAVESDFLRDADGHGWHIDRARFERWLRGIAEDRGAILVAAGRPQSIRWAGHRWRVRLAAPAGSLDVAVRLVIDAGGRGAPMGRMLGASRRRHDKLVCRWLYGDADPLGHGAGITYVQAAENGWWYTAPLPGNRRVLAFHTDADLTDAVPDADLPCAGARVRREPAGLPALVQRAAPNSELAAILAASRFTPTQHCGVTAAHGAVLHPVAGPAWFAVGDAAFSCDPLSSQGLLNALYTGLVAAEAADRTLSGNAGAVPEYVDTIGRVHATYREHLADCYRAETRWSNSPFWQRRHLASDDV